MRLQLELPKPYEKLIFDVFEQWLNEITATGKSSCFMAVIDRIEKNYGPKMGTTLWMTKSGSMGPTASMISRLQNTEPNGLKPEPKGKEPPSGGLVA